MMSFFDIDLFLGTSKELENKIINDLNLHPRDQTCYFALNPDCYLQSLDQTAYRDLLLSPEHVIYIDGFGIIYAQKMLGLPVARERIATTDLFPSLMSRLNLERPGTRIFLFGGKGDTAKRVIDKFSQLNPNIEFVGWQDGYLDEQQEEEMIADINGRGVDILFVGLGCPKQELWVERNRERLKVNAILTCGGLFDIYAGNIKRAPKFMQNIGLEWFYRLCHEPKRLYKRYIFGNLRYVTYMLRNKFKSSVAGGK